MSSALFENLNYKLFIYKSYIYKQDLALNNLRALICLKTQPTKPSSVSWGCRIH